MKPTWMLLVMANEQGKAHSENQGLGQGLWCGGSQSADASASGLWKETVQRVKLPCSADSLFASGCVPKSRVPWDGSVNLGGKFLLRLNISPNTIAYKYREGKVESTLERELNVPANVADKANGTLLQREMCSHARYGVCLGQ